MGNVVLRMVARDIAATAFDADDKLAYAADAADDSSRDRLFIATGSSDGSIYVVCAWHGPSPCLIAPSMTLPPESLLKLYAALGGCTASTPPAITTCSPVAAQTVISACMCVA